MAPQGFGVAKCRTDADKSSTIFLHSPSEEARESNGMSAGYSATPLIKKLDIKPGMRVAFVGAPAHYERLLGTLPEGVRKLARPGSEMNFVHCFCSRSVELHRRLPGAKRALAKDGMLWISWPKKSSSLHRDLAEAEV